MKKQIVVLIIVLSLCSASLSLAKADFDPSIYTKEELLEIVTIIYNYLPKTPIGEILYDDGSVYVEFRGIEKYSTGTYIINLFVENNRGEEVYLDLSKCKANRASFGVGNGRLSIPDDSIYLTKPHFGLVINSYDLRAYGIDTINQLDFIMQLTTKDYYNGEIFAEIPITLILDAFIGE